MSIYLIYFHKKEKEEPKTSGKDCPRAGLLNRYKYML